MQCGSRIMGGYGSGGPREKTTVEECLTLSAAKLQRDKVFRAGMHAAGSLARTPGRGRQISGTRAAVVQDSGAVSILARRIAAGRATLPCEAFR